MHRRRFLAAAAGGLGAGLAGCEQREVPGASNPDLLDERPSQVYVPTHTDGMQHVDTVSDGRLRFALSFARPHRFWLVTGTRVRQVTIGEADAMHLMLSVWDAETGVGVPTSNATITLSRDGESVLEKSLWSMLSQRMGVHFGDNVAIEDEGTYTVDVEYGPIESRLTGECAGIHGGQRSISFDLEYTQSAVADLGFEDLGYRAGREDAVEPMQMDMLPVYQLPPVADLPGTALGSELSGGALLAGRLLDAPPSGIEGDGPYLAVSARTPYNRYPLPFASLSAGPGEGAALTGVLDETLGFHYGRVLDERPDGPVEVTVDAPPQLARHEGYETAFVEMPAVTLSEGGN